LHIAQDSSQPPATKDQYPVRQLPPNHVYPSLRVGVAAARHPHRFLVHPAQTRWCPVRGAASPGRLANQDGEDRQPQVRCSRNGSSVSSNTSGQLWWRCGVGRACSSVRRNRRTASTLIRPFGCSGLATRERFGVQLVEHLIGLPCWPQFVNYHLRIMADEYARRLGDHPETFDERFVDSRSPPEFAPIRSILQEFWG
jgi:hypothetical protein